MKTFSVESRVHSEFIDITGEVAKTIRESEIRQGICVVFTPHTTAGITINENADPDVAKDIIAFLKEAIPHESRYLHGEGNSDAHIKSSLVGCSIQLIVEDGRPVLGTWQGIYFCEFDGPRHRKVHVKVVEG